MAAFDPSFYFDASFGGVPLLIADIETEMGRDIAVQSPSRGDKHVNQDRGRRHNTARATILFVDQYGLAAFTTRYDQFKALANSGVAQIFSHPLDASYRARISDLSVRASDASQIECTCTFLAEEEPEFVFPLGAGTTPAAGLDAVTAAADTATTELSAISVTSPVPSACVTAVSGWSTADVLDSQAVFVQVASLTGQISDAVDAYELATDLKRWAAYQAMINLAFQVSRAAEAFTSPSGQLFQITVRRDRPLLAICAEIYGAAAAQDRATQVAQINRIRTPGLVRAGTVLSMPPVDS